MPHHDPAGWHGSHLDLLDAFASRIPASVVESLERTQEIREPANNHHRLVVFRRFLIAEKLNLSLAVDRLSKHAAWRAEYLPNGAMPEASVTSQIEQQKVFLQPPGRDGRPLLIVRGSRHVPADMETCKRFITYSLEAASRLCDHPNSLDHKLWAMFDLKGLRWANLDARALRSSFQVLSSAFPERVHKIYMLDAPAIFDTIWQLVKPFIDPVSRTKIRFISRESGVRELQQMLDAEVLPKRYGGAADEIPVEIVARRFGPAWHGEDANAAAVPATVSTYIENGDEDEFFDIVEEDAGLASAL